MNDLTDAIKRIETSRQTHVDWRDYWLSTPGHEDCESCKATASIAGDLNRQVRVIAEYDNVLACLRAAESAEAAREAEKAAHERLRAGVEALAERAERREDVQRRLVTTTALRAVLDATPAPAEDQEPCIAPPGNLCTDPGCWDADRCVVDRPSARELAWAEFRDGPDYTPTDRYPVRDAFDAGWSLSLVTAGSEGWAAYAAEQERHAETAARLDRVRALADEWAEDYPGPNAACNRTPDEWATDLTTLLGGGEAR